MSPRDNEPTVPFRDYIEEGITQRLLRHGEHPVSESYYNYLLKDLARIIKFHATTPIIFKEKDPNGFDIQNERYIQGFTPDDLESLFVMKVYQVLSYNQYDPGRDALGFFSSVFRNLKIDIYRMIERLIKRGAIPDALLDGANLDDHMDIMEHSVQLVAGLTETEREILNICLDGIEHGDTTLVPLARLIISSDPDVSLGEDAITTQPQGICDEPTGGGQRLDFSVEEGQDYQPGPSSVPQREAVELPVQVGER